jgi:dihydrofolate reductase
MYRSPFENSPARPAGQSQADVVRDNLRSEWMRKLKFEMQVSVDGFAADSERSTGWMTWNWGEEWRWDEALRAFHTDLLATSDCLLISGEMAREGFFDHWAQRATQIDNPQSRFAAAIVAMRKLVFSRTLKSAPWKNAEIVTDDALKTIAALKAEDGKDILLYGGPRFASSLIRADLIDEFHFFINPVVLGRGVSMFRDLDAWRFISPVNAHVYPCGVVVSTYRRDASRRDVR